VAINQCEPAISSFHAAINQCEPVNGAFHVAIRQCWRSFGFIIQV